MTTFWHTFLDNFDLIVKQNSLDSNVQNWFDSFNDKSKLNELKEEMMVIIPSLSFYVTLLSYYVI